MAFITVNRRNSDEELVVNVDTITSVSYSNYNSGYIRWGKDRYVEISKEDYLKCKEFLEKKTADELELLSLKLEEARKKQLKITI